VFYNKSTKERNSNYRILLHLCRISLTVGDKTKQNTSTYEQWQMRGP